MLAGTKIPAKAELDSCKEAVKCISPEVLSPQHHHPGTVRLGGIGKKGNHWLRKNLHQCHNHQTITQGNSHGVPQGLICPVFFSGSDILGAQCGHGGKHGGRHQKEKADNLFHNAHGGGII